MQTQFQRLLRHLDLRASWRTFLELSTEFCAITARGRGASRKSLRPLLTRWTARPAPKPNIPPLASFEPGVDGRPPEKLQATAANNRQPLATDQVPQPLGQVAGFRVEP